MAKTGTFGIRAAARAWPRARPDAPLAAEQERQGSPESDCGPVPDLIPLFPDYSGDQMKLLSQA